MVGDGIRHFIRRHRVAPMGVTSFPVPWKASPAVLSCISSSLRIWAMASPTSKQQHKGTKNSSEVQKY